LETVPTPSENQELQSTEQVELQSFMPYMGLSLGDLTAQQERLVLYMSRGMTTAAAGRAAGYTTPQAAYDAAKRPAVVKALNYFREQFREEVHFTRVHAHSMYLDAYNSAATSTEMKNATDSLVKLHGLAAPDHATQININVTPAHMERMSDEDLLKLVGRDEKYLEPDST